MRIFNWLHRKKKPVHSKNWAVYNYISKNRDKNDNVIIDGLWRDHPDAFTSNCTVANLKDIIKATRETFE